MLIDPKDNAHHPALMVSVRCHMSLTTAVTPCLDKDTFTKMVLMPLFCSLCMPLQLEQAEATVHKLQADLQSSPQTNADAAKGIIRGPQLAAVELQLRKLLLLAPASAASINPEQPTANQAQQRNGLQAGMEASDADATAGAASGAADSGRADESQPLAEAVLAYYKQLGHMLSCASDLR